MQPHRLTFDAIGTSWSIETAESISPQVQTKVEHLIEQFDATYSRFREESLVSQIATQGRGSYVFPSSIIEIYSFYKQLYKATNGKVTPLIGSSLESIGYDKEYSLSSRGFTPAPIWNEVMHLEGTTLHVSEAITLDIGAAGKGYLVDQVGDILKQAGQPGFVIDASGDIYAYKSPQRIGLENPFDTNKVLGVATISNMALCASAVNRRQWGEGLHHVVDPSTGIPTDNISATWVIAPTAMQADGIATALFFSTPESLTVLADFSYAVLRKDGTMQYSKDNNWEMFT